MTPARPRRHTVVFDLDGTLLDSAPDIAEALNALFRDLSLPPVELDLIRTMIGEGAPVLLARALAHVGSDLKADDLMPRYLVHYDAHATGKTIVYPQVLDTLAALRALGCRLGVCTNKPYRATRIVLGAYGFDPLVEAVVGGDSLPQRKPAPEPLLHVIDALGATTETAVLVGDSAVDVACAKAAGVPCIIIPSGYGTHPPQAEVVAERFADLPEIIERLR